MSTSEPTESKYGNQILSDPNTLDVAQLKRRAGKTDRVVAYMQNDRHR